MHVINFNFNARNAFCSALLVSLFFPSDRTLLNAGNLWPTAVFVVRLCSCVARHGPREIPRLENYTSARRTSDYPWPVVEELKLNDEVNVRFLRDFEMHPRPLLVVSSLDLVIFFLPSSLLFFSFFPPSFVLFRLISRLLFFPSFSSPIPGVFSLNKFAALGNKTRLLFISAFFCRVGATKWVLLNRTTMHFLRNKLLIRFD